MVSIQLKQSLISCLQSIEDNDNTIITQLRYLLIMNHEELNIVEIHSILNLFIYGLEHSKVKDQKKWISDNSSYFSGNCFVSDVWKNKFGRGDFTYEAFVDYAKLIKLNPSKTNFDFSLRNIEVTLRDNVIFNDFEQYMDTCKGVLCEILYNKV